MAVVGWRATACCAGPGTAKGLGKPRTMLAQPKTGCVAVGFGTRVSACSTVMPGTGKLAARLGCHEEAVEEFRVPAELREPVQC